MYNPVAKFKTILFIVVIVPEKVYFSSGDLKQVLLHFMHDVPQKINWISVFITILRSFSSGFIIFFNYSFN